MKMRLPMLVLMAVLLTGVTPARAEAPRPGGGPEFGRHVSGMAPEHPREHGKMFGECMSTMAKGEECPHEHEPLG
jgi:hypothetical protein